MSEIPCDLVIKHEGLVSAMVADLTHIKKTVDNGLSKALDDTRDDLQSIQATLHEFMAATRIAAAEVKGDLAVKEANDRAENWFTRILNQGATKIMGGIVVIILASAVTNNALMAVLRDKYYNEPPGQQAQILEKQKAIQSTLSIYHTHLLQNGKTLYHSDDQTQPAWVLDPATGIWEKCPKMRTEVGVK